MQNSKTSPARWRQRAVLTLFLPGLALADPEIMVHEGDLAAPGDWTATLHANRTVKGDRARTDGTWPTHGLSFVMAEFATGLAPGWEAGIHLPAMRSGVDGPDARRGDWGASAVMFRIKHIRHSEDGLFYGFNAEYDINAGRYVADPRSIELRGIVGIDRERFRLTANPHLIWGFGHADSPHTPAFNVDWKALHKLTPDLAWGLELYSDWGTADNLQPGAHDRTLYLVSESNFGGSALHFGIGRGFKETPEHTVVKMVWSTVF